MSASPPAQPNTSVFHALGSYADRIKEKSRTPNGTSTASSSAPSPSGPQAKSPASAPQVMAEEDDGAWETVQSGRQKSRHAPRDEPRSRESSSRDWRERPSGKQEEERRTAKVTEKKKGATTGTPPNGTPHPPPPKAAPKNAWGLNTPAASSHPSPPASVISTTIQTPRSNAPSGAPTPSSPITEEPSAASMTSPNLSSDIASASTPPTSIAKDEEDWRTPSKAEEEMPPPPVPAPLVNAWAARQKAAGLPNVATPERPARLQFGTVTPRESPTGLPEDGVKITKKQNASVDQNEFPDLARAAEITQAEKKDDKKDKASEESSVADDPAAGKKPKWTAIPASELLAAADEAAEASRRAARDAVGRKKGSTKRGESSHSPNKGARRGSFDSRRGRGRSGSQGEIRLPPLPSSSRASSTFKPVFGSVRPGSTGSGEEEYREPSHGGFSAPLSRQTSRRSEATRSKTQVSSPASHALALDSTSRQGPASVSAPSESIKLPSHTAPLPQVPFAQTNNPANPRQPRRDNRGSFSGRGKFRGGKTGFGGSWNPEGLPDMPYPNGQPNLYQRGYGMGYGGYGYGYDALAAQGQYGGLGMYNPRGSNGGQGQGLAPAPMPLTIVPNLDALRFYVLGQVEYYFSMQNLAMDFFLRQQMDSEGWIDISMIASFNRIRSLTPEVSIVKEVMLLSSLLEVRDDKVRLARGESQRWVLPDAKPSPFTPDRGSPVQALRPSEDASWTNGGSGLTAEAPYNPYATEGYQYPEGFEQGIWAMPSDGAPDTGYGLGMGMSPAMQYQGMTPRFVPGDVENALMKNGGSTSGTTATGTETREGTEGGGDETAAEADGEGEGDEAGVKGAFKGDTPATSVEGDEERVKVELR